MGFQFSVLKYRFILINGNRFGHIFVAPSHGF